MYSWDLNNGRVGYSNGPNMSDHRMVCFSDHHSTNGPVFKKWHLNSGQQFKKVDILIANFALSAIQMVPLFECLVFGSVWMLFDPLHSGAKSKMLCNVLFKIFETLA